MPDVKGPLSMTDKIIAFEDGEMSPEEIRVFFAELYNTGTIRHLQGAYGRHFQTLKDNGEIVINEQGVAEAQDVDD